MLFYIVFSTFGETCRAIHRLLSLKAVYIYGGKTNHGSRKILEGGTTLRWVYMQNYMKIWSVWSPRREGTKEGGRQ